MLSGSDGFQESRQAFKELKKLVKEANAIMPRLMPGFSTNGCPRTLLPDRQSCHTWITQYCQKWGRIYAILDLSVLVEDLDEVFPLGPQGVVEDSLSLLRIFMVIGIAMQDSEINRLLGRRLARYVEDCIHSSTQFRKPSIEFMQLLLLLTIMKTISASDTDDMSNMLGIQGLTCQNVLVIGLHRDPAIFPNLSPYEAEMRKRLWACFLRLSLDYSIRSGTQFVLFVDDIDCPPPSYTGLQAFRNSPAIPVPEQWETEGQSKLDAKFSFFTAKLAKIIMQLQQTLCSNGSSHLASLQADIRRAFDEFLTELPLELKPGSPTSCGVQRLQQILISTTLHSFALIPEMSTIIGKPYDVSLQGHLMEVWDHSISILDQFQSLCQHTDDTPSLSVQTLAHQLLWADVARAALCSCLAVGTMHRRSLANLISAPMQQTAGIFEQVLDRSLSFLVQFWKKRFYHGPVTSKLALLLAVAMTVTANLRDVSHLQGDANDNVLKRMGIAVAEEWVNGMRGAIMEQRQAQALTNNSSADIVGTTGGSPAIVTPTSEDVISQDNNIVSEHISMAADSTVDEQLPNAVTPTSTHTLDLSAGGTFGMDFTNANHQVDHEFSNFDDLEFGSDGVEDSIMEILNGLEMAPMDSVLGFGYRF